MRIKIYEVNDGSVIYQYIANESPRNGEYIFIGDKQGIVKEVYHIFKPVEDKNGGHLWVEVGVEFIA